MSAYYNEIDRYAVAWLRNLIAADRLLAGTVDERSIVDIGAADIVGFNQCHFFAGIGGWPYALHLAGWPNDEPVWTGSCPCQPFSIAGKQKGSFDERHLWPAFLRLIIECRPPTIFGEQVASPLGRKWFSRARTHLEALGYAVGAADLCAASVSAPHIRQRLFWVAYDPKRRSSQRSTFTSSAEYTRYGPFDGSELGNSVSARLEERTSQYRYYEQKLEAVERTSGDVIGLDDAASSRYASEGGRQSSESEWGQCGLSLGCEAGWSNAAWFPCLDGKARRIEPSIFPLADGVSNRVGRLRAYGNAIVPQVAATFIRAVMPSIL